MERSVYQPALLSSQCVYLPVNKQCGELRQVSVFASLIACNAVAGRVKNHLPLVNRHLWTYMCTTSSHSSTPSLRQFLFCSQQFLEAFSVKAHFIVLGMCISYTSYSPIMQAEVCIDSQQLVALYNRII